jgi:hypothetical protein
MGQIIDMELLAKNERVLSIARNNHMIRKLTIQQAYCMHASVNFIGECIGESCPSFISSFGMINNEEVIFWRCGLSAENWLYFPKGEKR